MTTIKVLDAETTGLARPEYNEVDEIVEVAIVEVDLDTGVKKILLDELVHSDLFFREGEVFIRDKGIITVDDMKSALPVETVAPKVRAILANSVWTTFNTDFDYGKFLVKDPWNVSPPAYCLMKEMTPICRMPKRQKNDWHNAGDTWKWPRLTEAWSWLYLKSCPEIHRARPDTLQAADVAFGLAKFLRIYNLFQDSMDNDPEQTFEIHYQAKSGQASKRTILPIRFKTPSLIGAYCQLRQQERTFDLRRIQRIISIPTVNVQP